MFMQYIIKALGFLFVFTSLSHAQNDESDKKCYTGIFAEYNTLILTHNLKLYSDFNFYQKEFIIGLQPGAEIVYSFSGAERTFYSAVPFMILICWAQLNYFLIMEFLLNRLPAYLIVTDRGTVEMITHYFL